MADQTEKILMILREAHGDIRQDPGGAYFFGNVSAISLAMLLAGGLPSKEVLWAWYSHFDMERSESIYQSIAPADDERLLEILGACGFSWNEQELRASGLVFGRDSRELVYRVLEREYGARIDHYRNMDDGALREALDPGKDSSGVHLNKLRRRMITTPLEEPARRELSARLKSDYQRATARHLLEEATSELFWKNPPPELELTGARFSVFGQIMMEASIRLGVYSGGRRQDNAGRQGGGRPPPGRNVAGKAMHLAVLGLGPEAGLAEVRSAYRAKVKQHHPDRGGAQRDFQRIQEAYEYLAGEAG
ncbi:MAG: DnaJ domain-containing protein [Deltaproteobacteria bacterium]|nr:DnaJ domain-containing protein [Deltaproteobacteria bacterium]